MIPTCKSNCKLRRFLERIRKLNWERIIYLFVFASLVLATVSVVVMIITAPSDITGYGDDVRSKSDYVLMLVQCILGIFAMLLPGLLEHKINLIVPSKMMMIYALFLYCAIYLGEVRNYYFIIPNWDNILHATSGGMLSALGFSFIVLLNKTDRVPVNLSPVFICLFAFSFAVTLGTFWEIYEFSVDGLLGLNMQKFALEDGTQLTGHAALKDTMQDLIIDAISAFAISSMGYISLIYKKGWIERLLLKIHKKEDAPHF